MLTGTPRWTADLLGNRSLPPHDLGRISWRTPEPHGPSRDSRIADGPEKWASKIIVFLGQLWYLVLFFRSFRFFLFSLYFFYSISFHSFFLFSFFLYSFFHFLSVIFSLFLHFLLPFSFSVIRDVPVLIFTVFRFRLFKNLFFGFGYSKISFSVSVLRFQNRRFRFRFCFGV